MQSGKQIVPLSEVTEYFRAKAEGMDSKTRGAYKRAGNALHRAGYHTMEAVCALTDEQLKRIRDVGIGTQSIITKEIACYRQGSGTEGQHRKQSGVPSISHLNKEE